MFLLTTLTMIAFAANSVLNRLALAEGGMDPYAFGALRLAAGAMMLAALVLRQGKGFAIGGRGRLIGVGALLLYIFGFSAAYRTLDAGLGALILFGVVQITMFAGALAARDAVPPQRWAGAALAFGGLVWLLWPGQGAEVPMAAGALMVAAGVGWGLYSLAGRGAGDATRATAMNFILAAPVGVALWLALGGAGAVTPYGLALAVISGAGTSGLGYALWYAILPGLGAARAAVAQLTVPVIAMAGGMLFLGEALSGRFVIAACLVLGGVALSVLPGRVGPDQSS